MRIIHSFNADKLKISLFIHSAKYSIKVQDQGYEFLLPLGDIEGTDLPARVEFYFTNTAIVRQYKLIIQQIHDEKLRLLQELIVSPDSFDTII